MTKVFLTHLKSKLPDVAVFIDEPMSKHTSFKIGGTADIYLIPKTQAELVSSIHLVREHELPLFIIGNGSNILVSDKGIRGVVIDTTGFAKIIINPPFITSYSGTKLEELTMIVGDEGMTGLEFAHGIPGTVGGAVTMNAGAYGGEIKDVLYSATLLTATGEVVEFSNEQMQFEYRKSIIQSSEMIVLSATFKLEYGILEEIEEKMEQLKEERWCKQPMDFPSGGSVFKRPPGHYTGKLIDDCNLRGYQVGGAGISDKHCGFIVNLGNATANDVMSLIKFTQATVKKQYGVTLERELKLVGDWDQ